MNKKIYTKFYTKIAKDRKQAPNGLAQTMAKDNGISLNKFYAIIRKETDRRVTLLQAIKVCKYQKDKEEIKKLI